MKVELVVRENKLLAVSERGDEILLFVLEEKDKKLQKADVLSIHLEQVIVALVQTMLEWRSGVAGVIANTVMKKVQGLEQLVRELEKKLEQM